jgi:hypothetical protein
MTIRGPIPEKVRKLMDAETRKDLGKAGMTQPEADAKFVARREKEIQENIAALLRQRGIWFSRQRMDRKSTAPVGTPDFIFAVHGRACAVEVKTPEGVLSDEQRCTGFHMIQDGWVYKIAHSEAEFLEFLNTIQPLDGEERGQRGEFALLQRCELAIEEAMETLGDLREFLSRHQPNQKDV